ncbi:MAG: hypothetical protein SA378_08915 [Sedimentibacter sp.]|uniref:hypothetical protein n=1 Tax=Sedimentibacter sp. TaxID=1960295 RepID=UPI0029816A31|nr:hypothetical protein [Sedimentibacter sp.]MDW5300243.1 hypothetical protein [Sedimentibacter sp.]
MKDCTISIDAPIGLLKGAGIPNTLFIPSRIYQLKIEFKNVCEYPKLCSFSSTLGNGIRYFKNMTHSGPDVSLLEKTCVIEPSAELGNNNVIVFANNFIISPNSTNTLTFDIALCDKYTKNCLENSGDKIPHKSKINFYGHLINENNIDSCSTESLAHDYEIQVKCDDETIKSGETTKYYVHCNAGQYDMSRSVYLRSILDEGLEFIADSCNLEPRNVYKFNGRTIIKWDIGNLQPSESKRIGYMVKLKNDFKTEPNYILKNKLNSNCVNNSVYTQCPVSCQCNLKVE